MSPRISELRGSSTAAYVAPFFAFILFMPLVGLFQIDNSALPWYTHSPEHWVYPLQTVCCILLLAFFWPRYVFRPVQGIALAVALGLIGILVWVTPALAYDWLDVEKWRQPMLKIPLLDPEGSPVWKYLGLAPREEGFDPTLFRDQPFWFGAVILMRFVRMVVVVALVEEIFWRGFLMRFLVNMDRPFIENPFGKHTWTSYLVTTLAFALVHNPEDWIACLVYGSMTYWLAVRTKSLFACVLMHAVANLTLGIYVMTTQKWGYW